MDVENKWDTIDDEVWSKIVIMQRNRRIAKAYVTTQTLTVNGSRCGFQGTVVGLNGFQNLESDPEVDACKSMIDGGCKLKLTESGDVLIKRAGHCPIIVSNGTTRDEINSSPLEALEQNKPMKIFDMRRFKQSLNREMKKSKPNWHNLKLQVTFVFLFKINDFALQTIISFSFGIPKGDFLHSAVWVVLLNMVALEMIQDKIDGMF